MKFRILIAFLFIVGLVWSQNEVTPPIDTFPEDSIPEDSVSLDSLPLDSLPLDTIIVDTLPMDSLPLDTIIVDTLPMDTIPVDTVIVDTVIVDTIPSIEIVNIENPAVQAYMADSTYYYDTDYNTSVILDYNTPEYWESDRDYPNGKVVKWTPGASVSEIAGICITVSENENFSDSVTFYPASLLADNYTICNMIPDRTYYYKVEETHVDKTVAEVASGAFRTVGQVRMIRVDGCRNVRDMGGWMTQFGKPIRYGRLYRSGKFEGVTKTGIHDFKDNLKVKAELDLREESRLSHSPLGYDVDYQKYDNSSYYKGLANYGFVYANDMKWVVARLREGKNVDWHCAIGCDRCGTFSFLVGGVLGMSELDLCRDYELSTFSGNDRPRGSETYGFDKVIPYIREFGPENDLARCFYNYLLSVGVEAVDLDYLRSVMLEGFSVDTGCKQVAQACVQSPLRIYSINGIHQSCLQKGINIVVGEDGTVSKCYIK